MIPRRPRGSLRTLGLDLAVRPDDTPELAQPRLEVGHVRRQVERERSVELAVGERKLPRVMSLIRPENLPSQGVARKLGMNVVHETTFVGFKTLVYARNAPDL